jgi:hypothetical protein
MSDLLLPFLLLMDDDALAFWCFVSLMQRMGARHNFAVDERGIFAQLRLLGQVGCIAVHIYTQFNSQHTCRYSRCLVNISTATFSCCYCYGMAAFTFSCM